MTTLSPTSARKVTVPKIIEVPPKLLPIITDTNDYDYFLVEGGRGSGKSQTIARFLLYLGCLGRLRIVCGRETQNTIEESVYTLLKDMITQFNLDYEVFSNRLEQRRTGTVFIFKGFREQGKVNIKGLEGCNVLWVDEAQAITADTLKIIIPTIRAEKSKSFYTMNRYLEDDPVYQEFAGRPDCLHIHIDYFENPFCPQKLLHEAEVCKTRNVEDYDHIWRGIPFKKHQNAAFYNVDSIVDVNMSIEQPPVDGFQYVLGSDLGKSVDHTSISILCIQLKRLVFHQRLESQNKSSWHYQKQLLCGLGKKYNDALVVTDSTGVGDPITEDLQRMGANVFVEQQEQRENPKEVAGFKFTQVSKENLMEKLKVAIELQCFKMPYIKTLVEALKRFQAIRQPNGRVKYSMPEERDEFGVKIYVDDEVMSLALALWGSRMMIYDPAYQAPKKVTETDRFWKRVTSDIKNNKNLLQDGESYEILESEDILI